MALLSYRHHRFPPEIKASGRRLPTRPGFDRTAAVQHGDLYEIKSPWILQSGRPHDR